MSLTADQVIAGCELATVIAGAIGWGISVRNHRKETAALLKEKAEAEAAHQKQLEQQDRETAALAARQDAERARLQGIEEGHQKALADAQRAATAAIHRRLDEQNAEKRQSDEEHREQMKALTKVVGELRDALLKNKLL